MRIARSSSSIRFTIIGRLGAAIFAMTLLIAGAGTATAAPAARWHSWAPNGAKSYGKYDVRNNEWNCPCGPQEIWADSGTHWGIHSDQAKGNTAVLSGPDDQVLEYKSISRLPKLVATYNLSQPTKGDFEADYDIWIQDNGQTEDWSNDTEVMVWVDNHGQRPAGNVVTHGRIYGKRFTLWSTGGKDQSNVTYSLVFANSHKGVTHLAAIFTWLTRHGWISPNAADLDVEFGWEICSTNGVYENFTMNSYVLKG
jgi:Glycosyl hydrolase family 12